MADTGKKKKKKSDEEKVGNDDDDELTRLALEELTRGAKRAKERTETMGALGWKNNPIPSANKRYLKNTLIGALQTNSRVEKRSQEPIKKKEESENKKEGEHSSRDSHQEKQSKHSSKRHNESDRKRRLDTSHTISCGSKRKQK